MLMVLDWNIFEMVRHSDRNCVPDRVRQSAANDRDRDWQVRAASGKAKRSRVQRVVQRAPRPRKVWNADKKRTRGATAQTPPWIAALISFVPLLEEPGTSATPENLPA